jgi:nitrogen regulatory protein PII
MNVVEKVLITCIIERGQADEVMFAARQAGAKGGTILPARGTGTADDKNFLGITLMPAEKEMLLIVAERGQVQGIMDAVRKMPLFSRHGHSLIYTTPIGGFFISDPEAS